jgi:hypothetical protein
VWTHAEAQKALPYISSIMCSAREHQLQARAARLHARRLRERPGRPDRDTLLALEGALREAERAEGQLHDALRELWRLNVYCLDPIQGTALIPFAHAEQQLAWYVFELFEKDQLRSWRFHGDPLETRRPLSECAEEPPSSTLIV